MSRLERDSAGHSSDGRDLRDDIGQLRTEVAVIGSDVRGILAKLGSAGSNARDVLRTVAAVVGPLIAIAALIISIALTR